jgi:dCMP deaminase
MEKQNLRPDWETHAMNLAEVAMLRSEDPFQKVGACILGHNHEVLAVAYNGLAAGKDVGEDFWEDRDKRRPYMIHAETNALSRIKRGDGLILACTLLPCRCCATNIAAYGINHVIYKDVYKRDDFALYIFDFYGITCKQLP